MSFESSRSLEKGINQDVERASADASFSLFNATMQPDGIFGTRPSSPWATLDSKATSPFQNADTKPTSSFQNVDNRPSAPMVSSDNGSAWRAGFGETALVRPHLAPHPNPWGSPSDSRPVPAPTPQTPRNDAPPPVPRPVPIPTPTPGNEPWDKAPGGPWRTTPSPAPGGGWDRPTNPSPAPGGDRGTPGGDRGAPGGGPWDRGPWGNDRGNSGGSGSKPAADAAFERDKVERTSHSFNEAVRLEKQVARESEVVLEQQMRDWLAKQASMNPITHMRGTALLSDALGEFRLEEGSRIDLRSHQDTKPRILKDYYYDFGGEANTWLRMSAGSLVAAQQYVRGNKGRVIDGQPMDDAYLQQLKGLQTKVESQLNVIYGPHDVEGVYSELVRQVRVNSGDWQQGLVRLQHQLDALKTTDTKFIAKSARDVALGYLAEADYMSSKNNGEDAKIMYQAANKYLAMSQQNDSGAPDNVAIATISQRLKPQIQKAIDNQWSDPFGNPFEIPQPPNTMLV